MQAQRKSESKVLDRTYVEIVMDDKAGRLTRKEAVEAVAGQLGVPAETVALMGLEGQSGTGRVTGRFYVYGSPESKKRIHPRHLEERNLTKEERDKLRQERKKAKTAAPAAEAAK